MKKPGRPAEGRVRMTVRVKPGTRAAIRAAKTKEANTDGKVIDVLISVECRKH